MTLGTEGAPPARCSPVPGAAGRVGCGGPKARSWQRSWPARPRGAWRAARTAPALIVFAGAGRQVGTHVPHRAGPRACRLSPRSCPASSAFFPSHPSLLGTGMDPVPPSPWGAGGGGGPRCAGACSACAECRGERCPAPRHGRALGSHRAGLGTAKPLPVPKHGEGVPQCPPSQRLLQEGRRAPGWPGDGRHRRCSLVGCLGLFPRLAGLSWSRRRRALSTDAAKASIHLLRAAVNHPPAMPVALLPSQPGCPAARGSPGEG